MIASEKKVGRAHYRNSKPSSPILTEAAQDMLECKKAISEENNRDDTDEDRLEELKLLLKEAKREFRDIQQKAEEHRKTHLQELATKKAKMWQVTAQQAAVVISEAEESRKIHNKHKHYLKPKQNGSTKYVMVPAPTTGFIPQPSDITNPTVQTRVDEPMQIFNILLRQNFRQLLKSQHAITSDGQFYEKIGVNVEKDFVQEILQGIPQNTYSPTIEEEPVLQGSVTDNMLSTEEAAILFKHFIAAMKYAETEDGRQIPEYIWKYGVEEYKNTFSKTRESTACGPSGLHMSHWKAALEREPLMRVHLFFIWAAFQFGFSYSRWEISWHCMLQKKEYPYSQKMRIIQLFEGDFNGALKYLMGRRLMWHITNNNIIDADTYGSRLGKTATEAIINLQLIFDYCRTTKTNLGMLFNNADRCFDRIPPNLADIALRRIGCPSSIVKTHTEAQRKMRHYIKTGTGVSTGYITFSMVMKSLIVGGIIILLQGPIGGVGQGGGGSPIIWLAILLMLIEAYKKTNEGVQIKNPITGDVVKYWIISYVDDNTILRCFNNNAKVNEMLETLKHSLLQWDFLLRLTGGALSLGKCKVSLMHWRQDFWGQLRLSTNKHNQTIAIPSEETGGQMDNLTRLEPWQSERILGVRLPMDGNMNNEFKFRVKQIDNLAAKISRAPLSPKDMEIVYQSRYKAMIKYALPVTIFNDEQLQRIQSKFVFNYLPKVTVNRHMPRSVVYAPLTKGGLGIMGLRVEQIISALKTMIGHMRRNDNAGKSIVTNLIYTQIESGVSEIFLKYNPQIYGYVTKNSRWYYVWERFYSLRINLQLYNAWIPHAEYEDDRNIMETAIQDAYFTPTRKWKLEIINNCRMYIGFFYLSEIMDSNGQVERKYLDGSARVLKYKHLFGHVRVPPKSAWSEWKAFIFRNFLLRGYCVHPPIGTKKTDDIIVEKTEKQHMMTMQIGRTLADTLNKLPESMRKVVKHTSLPSDNGAELIAALNAGTLVGASDGSLRQNEEGNYGGYGFSIQAQVHDEHRIVGMGSTPKTNDMTSLTSEMFGILGTLIVVYIISLHNSQNDDSNRSVIHIFSDNKEAIQRSSDRPEPLNVSEHMKAEYDVMMLIWDIQDLLPHKIKHCWVKGHQDTTKSGEKLYGPFVREVQLNIEMDRVANEGCKLEPWRRPIFSHTKMGFYNNNGVMITNWDTFLYEYINGPTLHQYISEKYGWEIEQVNTLMWQALGDALKSYSKHKQKKIIQLLYDWQNDGAQKFKLGQDPGQCNFCAAFEDHLHYLECDNPRLLMTKQAQLGTLIKALKKLNTYPGITSTMATWLRSFDDRLDTSRMQAFTYTDILLVQAIEEQNYFGVQALAKGLLTEKWSNTQAHWCHTQEIPCDMRRWKKKVLVLLHDYTRTLWLKRNDLIHGETESKQLEIQKYKCKKRITELYQMSRQGLTIDDKKLFNLPLVYRVKGSVAGMKLWIDRAEMVFQKRKASSKKIFWWFPRTKRWIKQDEDKT